MSWTLPLEHGAPITAYQVLILTSVAGIYAEELVNCNGADQVIVFTRSCVVPMSVLRVSPFNLNYPADVVVVVKAYNANGWSPLSEPSLPGGIVFTEPATMQSPYRGTDINILHPKNF